MSYEDRVIPFEVMINVTSGEVTPRRGKGALGKWWALKLRQPSYDGMILKYNVELKTKRYDQGEYVGKDLNLWLFVVGFQGKPLLPTVFGKSDRTG